MNDLLAIAAQNTIAAAALALLVYGLTRFWRRPPVAHLLWLLVLAKLIGPPVLNVDVTGLFASRSSIEPRGGPDLARENGFPGADPRTAVRAFPSSVSRGRETLELFVDDKGKSDPASSSSVQPVTSHQFYIITLQFIRSYSGEALTAAFIVWIAGFGFFAAVSFWRITQFNRTIRETLAAPQRLQNIVADLARKLGLRRVPDLRIVDGIEIPMVWCIIRRPIIALPARLASELDEQQTSMVLAHELAHLKRRDHWVRCIELVISLIYWWNPLVWSVRRKLHEFEELCCDAWVAWAFPHSKKCYAEALFKAATLASRAHRRAPALASPFLIRGSLRGRIEAVLEGSLPRQVSPISALALAVVAIVLLPSVTPSVEAAAARPASASPPQKNAVDSESLARTRGKIVGTVTVSGTDEPVSGATVRFMLGKSTKGLSIYHDALTGQTDSSGHYSIDVPFGNVSVGRFDAPPGFWSEGGAAEQMVTSPDSPVATKNFSVRRGLPLRLRAVSLPNVRPVSCIQCITTRVDPKPRVMSWCDTDAVGMARVTLPGFHGEFRLVVVEFWEPTGKWESPPEPATLSIEPGFRIDQIRRIELTRQVAPPPQDSAPYRIIDVGGKVATLRHAQASLAMGELLIHVGLKPVDPTRIGDVRGIVVDEKGQPIPDARVGLVASSIVMTGVTGTDGQFSLRDHWIRTVAQPGMKLRLAVIKDGYGGVDTRPIARPANPSVPIDFGQIVLLPGKSIRVRVLDGKGKPARGAWVEPTRSWSAGSQIAMTDDRGECEVRNLPAGATELRVTYGNASATSTAFAGDATDPLTIRMAAIPGENAVTPSPEKPAARNMNALSLVGKTAPPLSIKQWTDGKNRSLSDFKGKVVALYFWGIRSGPCGYAMPAIKNLEARFKNRDVVFLGIHTAGTELRDVRSFLEHIQFNLPTAIDSREDKTINHYRVDGIPTLILISRDGRVHWTSRLPTEDGAFQRAAHALSIPWPIDEKQPQETQIKQGWRIQEYLFSQAIDRALQ